MQTAFFSVSADGQLTKWSIGHPRPALPVPNAHRVAAQCVACHPSGFVASGGADRALKLWDGATGKGVQEAHEHSGPVLAMAFSPSGNMLVSAGSEGELLFWTAGSC